MIYQFTKVKIMATTKVIIGSKALPVRFSYAHIWEPKAVVPGQEEKYSVSILIPKSDKKTIQKINEAIDAALEEGKPKFGGKIPARFKSPLRDGDIDRPEDEAYQDHYYINANNTRKPEVVDANLEEIMDRNEFYSGCFGRASVNFFAYNFENTSKGVGASLNNLQKLEDGDPFGAVTASASSDFGDEDDLM